MPNHPIEPTRHDRLFGCLATSEMSLTTARVHDSKRWRRIFLQTELEALLVHPICKGYPSCLRVLA
jgi:hypothetical protein